MKKEKKDKREKEKKHKKPHKDHSLDHVPARVPDHPAAAAARQPHATPQPAAPSSAECPAGFDARVETLVREIIERVADKWTMVLLDVLAEHGVVRFSQLAKLAGGVSQKMLTKTLRQMESDGLVRRTVHPVIPPHVEYQLTQLGHSLGQAFCGVWTWAEANYDAVERARATFRAASPAAPTDPNAHTGLAASAPEATSADLHP